jgi:hypothetical protein
MIAMEATLSLPMTEQRIGALFVSNVKNLYSFLCYLRILTQKILKI